MESTTELFPQALAHHRAGRLEAAETLYQSILERSPDHADSLNLLGVIAHQKGENDRAANLIARAITLHPDRPAYHCNLAAAYSALGRFDEAEKSSRTALALDPHETKALLNLGLAYQGAKRWPEAEQVYRDLAELFPKDPIGPQSLGDFLRECGKIDEAAAAYREALARHPNHGPVHLVLGTMLLTGEDPQGAEPHLRRAADLLPNVLAAQLNYGSCLTRLGRGREALEIYESARQIAPGDVNLAVGIGKALLEQKEAAEAENWFNSVLMADPSNAEAVRGLADVAQSRSLFEAAISLYKQSIHLSPSFEAFSGLSDSLWKMGDTQRAQGAMREAIKRFPNIPEAYCRLGGHLVANGEIEAAAENFREALRLKPYFPAALGQLASSLKARLPEKEKAALETALGMPNSKSARFGMHYGLAQVEDALGNFEKAAAQFHLANSLEAEHRAEKEKVYDCNEASERVDEVVQTFTREHVERAIKFGHDSEKPVFVIGMPRSGTTLVEQILSSHPRVFGAGECPFVDQTFRRLPSEMVPIPTSLECVPKITFFAVQNCANWYLAQIEKLGGRADRIVDKLPDNYLFLGWIAIMFPKARIIHCRRDLRDIALSCWTSEFANVPWANSIRNIAERIRNYQRIMAHWRSVLPISIFDLQYEELVADQEGQSRRLIDFLGLEWDAKCLNFHQTKRVVQTASMTQVRKPIYTRSVGRWRHYVDTLRPLIEELGLGFD